VDAWWWVGAPIAGSGIIALGLVVPMLSRRGLPVPQLNDPKPVADHGNLLRVVRRKRPITARSPVEATTEAERVGADVETGVQTVTAVADAALVTHAPPAGSGSASAQVDGDVPPPSATLRPLAGLSRMVRRIAQGGRVVALRKPFGALALGREIPGGSEGDAAAETSVAVLDAGTSAEEEPLDATIMVRENAIVDVAAIDGEPVAPTADEVRERLASRVVALTAALDAVQRERDAAADAERVAAAQLAAVQHQAEIERLALAEEARLRAEARTRWWFFRLDKDLEFATIEQRMAMASSLGCVHAAWAPKLLLEAFDQEQEPRVRARIIGALAAGDHFDLPVPFQRAFDGGGIERAAVCEVLLPRRTVVRWAEELLAPVLASV
jgi:hypothetical protein